MSNLTDLLRQYAEVLDQERRLDERKETLRAAILDAMREAGKDSTRTPFGSASRRTRFKLLPRRDEVLALLGADDLFPFASFTPNKVKDVLVPRYGRERLLPLFEIEKTEYLQIQGPHAPPRPADEA